MNEGHLSDDRLIDICLNASTALEQAHLAICARCEARRIEIVAILAELDDAATQDAGVAFPEARLEKQHASILHRVEHDGRPGRLVAFPAQQPSAIVMTPTRPPARWAAAVAAAAFVAGVITGNWTHTFSDRGTAFRSGTASGSGVPSHIIASEGDAASLRPVPTTFSEDEFLEQIEAAASRNGPAALRPLDAMTPRAGEVR
jgi:hypothetical protein